MGTDESCSNNVGVTVGSREFYSAYTLSPLAAAMLVGLWGSGNVLIPVAAAMLVDLTVI